VPKTVLIQDKIAKFKISSALWELFRLKFGKATNKELRSLIFLSLKTKKLWIEAQKLLDELGLKTTKNELIEILLEAWIRKTKRNLETGET